MARELLDQALRLLNTNCDNKEIMRSGFVVSLAAGVSILASVLSGQAPTRPDFSGDWQAIMEDGNLIPPYLGEHIRIEHREPVFIITTKVDDGKPIVFRFGADGKEHAATARKMNVRTSARWEGDALLVSSEIASPNGQIAKARERWTLSPNRRKLLMQGYFEHDKTRKNQLLEYERK
jgi:hypothetical protein